MFQYQARDSGGQLIKGKMEAESQSTVLSALSSKNLIPIKVEQVKQVANLKSIMAFEITPKNVRPDDMIMFCRQMYTLSKAGVPILSGLTRLAETTRSPLLAKTLKEVADKITTGQTLTQALSKYPKVFKNVFVALVDAGEQSGQLELAFEELANYFELERETKKRIKSATRYPTIVIGAIIVAFGVINFMVLPTFADMFKSFGADLPLITRVMIGMSNWMVTNWPSLLIIILALVVGVHFYLKTPKGRLNWDRTKLKLPLVGSIIHRIIMARFSRVFTMTLKSGVPMVQGISLIARTVGNKHVEQKMEGMREGIEKGDSLTKCASESNLFSPIALQMITVGEESGSIDTMLTEVADFYEREVDYDLKRLGDAIEPILLVIIGVLVMLLALAVFLPMADMSSFASR